MPDDVPAIECTRDPMSLRIRRTAASGTRYVSKTVSVPPLSVATSYGAIVGRLLADVGENMRAVRDFGPHYPAPVEYV